MQQDRCRRNIMTCLSCVLILGTLPCAGEVGVALYEAELELHPERNGVGTRAYCLLRNDGRQEIGQLSFDLLAKEERCRARLTMEGIWQKSGGKWMALTFERGTSGQGASDRRLTHVTLAAQLAPNATAELVFEYQWEATDPTNARDNYRPFATLPNGEKELCLLSDLAWLPRVRTEGQLEAASKANRFSREIKPSWTIRVSAPKDYAVVALGGRHVRTEARDEGLVSEWQSTVPIYPQLMAGRFHQQTIPASSIRVIFHLPKDYDHALVPRIGKELGQAFGFFREMFGPVDGNEIHVGVSSAGQGGHAGYLSFTMGTDMLGRQITEERLPAIMEIMRHELAHSWWGWSISSYGRGTKFLRESLANYANACFVEETTDQDRFAADMAKLFWMGLHTDVLCGPDGDSERASYLKGPVVLNVLQLEMGREKFVEVLRHFASEYRGGHATMSDFIAACKDVTGKDWAGFFDQWCFSGGVPDYRLQSFTCERQGDAWHTQATVRNAGGATITCPLELQTRDGRIPKSFRIEPGKANALAFTTSEKVTEVVIDPNHRTCQGSGRECRLKMLGVGNSDMEWIWYWRGVVLAEEGRYEEAISEISRAMAAHGHPAFSYSRALACLKNGDARAARADFVDFLDAVINNSDPCRSLVYPGLLSGNKDRQWEQLNLILQALTNQSFTTPQQWRTWWQANRSTFQLSDSARRLVPGGPPQG